MCLLYMCTRGERGGSVVECQTPEREVGGSKPTAAVLCPCARHFTPRSTGLFPRKRWLRPDMTEKLLTGTLSLNTNKQNYMCTSCLLMSIDKALFMTSVKEYFPIFND